MKRQQILVWTGGQPFRSDGCRQEADALPFLPSPTPLRRAVLIEYYWGATRFEIAATACSVRAAPWGEEPMTWLHCKAMQTAKITPEGSTTLMCVLIPTYCVTAIKPGPTFSITRSRKSNDIGVFPPNQPPPPGALPLAEIERVLAELMTPERN